MNAVLESPTTVTPRQTTAERSTRPIPPRPAARRPSNRMQRFLRSPKGSLTLVFLPIVLVAGASIGWPAAIPHLLAALAGACLLDLAIMAATRRKLIWPSSAILSGLIVAFVLGPLEPHWVTFAVAALATVSKHLLRTRQGHIFNPAALALVASVPLFGAGQSWWGAMANLSPIWLLLVLATGVFILERTNKVALALTFLAFYFGLFAFGALLNPARVAEMFRMPFTNATLFLAFFMLTDPPTSPGKLSDQVWFGALVAIVSAVAQLVGVGQTYLLVGLLAGNLALAGRRAITQRAARAAAVARAAAR